MFDRLFNRRKWLSSDIKRLGRWAEKRAERYLRRKGLKLLARNYSWSGGEIDLVMVGADGAVVFVEVRCRAEEFYASPESTITDLKRTKLLRTADYFLTKHNIESRPLRFDFVAVVPGRAGKVRIRHHEGVFQP